MHPLDLGSRDRSLSESRHPEKALSKKAVLVERLTDRT